MPSLRTLPLSTSVMPSALVRLLSAPGHRARPLGVYNYDAAITHERPGIDCGAHFGIVCPGRRCMDRWRQQHPPGVEQVRNRVDAREGSQAEEDSRIHG